MRPLRHLLPVTAALWLTALGAVPASADWVLYVSGEMGTSSANTTATGANFDLGLVMQSEYSDSSPLIAGAFGIEIPIDEATPWELPYDVRVPNWPMRFEIEATGLRSFEGIMGGFSVTTPMFGSTDSWTLMFDYWQDVPMGGLNAQLARIFGRTPRWLVKTLDAMTFYAGGGVGVAGTSYQFTDTFHIIQGDTNNFAWQAGAGFGYELTKAVTLTVGYRYFNYGRTDTLVVDLAQAVRGPFSFDQGSNEFRAGLRFKVWGFHNPWL
jgi:hypothetical protein